MTELAPPQDGLYALKDGEFFRIDTITGTDDGDVIGIYLNDGGLAFYYADFDDKGWYVATRPASC